MMDNDQDLYNKSREIVDHGVEKGWSDEEIAKRLQEWAVRNIISPHNRDAIKDAQEWNDIPKEERIDPHYEDLKNKSPQAADLVDSLGFGPNVEDTEPTLIREDLVNWDELVQGIKDEFNENQEYEDNENRLHGMGLSWTTPGHNDDIQQARDAFYRWYGAMPEEDLKAEGAKWADPRAYYNINVDVPYEHMEAGHFGSWPDNWLDHTTRAKLWNLPGYDPKNPNWDDPQVQALVNEDPNIKPMREQGFKPKRLSEVFGTAWEGVTHGRPNPYVDILRQALEARGYTPEQIEHIMRQRWQWDPETQEHINLEPRPPAPPDPTLDQPGDFTLPDHWGSVHMADEWDDYFNQPDYSEDYYEKRRPFLVEFANSVEDPAPKVWIGEPNTFHGDRPRDFDTPGAQHRYYGEIWENTNPPTFKGAPPDRVYDEQALYHAQRAYYNQQNIQKRAMAERSGDPDLDKLIEEFLNIENLSEHPDTKDTYPHRPDEDPTKLYSPEMFGGEYAFGNCGHMTQTFNAFLERRGIKAGVIEMTDDPEWGTPAPDGSFADFGYGDRQNLFGPGGYEYDGHAVSKVEMPTGTYMVDWTPAQYGYQEFPMVQKLNDGQWQRKWSMADRTGNPEVDALIEEFLQMPQGDWTTDDDPYSTLSDPERAHGNCQSVTEHFVEFAKSKGFKAYETNTDIDEMGYTPTGEGGEIGFDENDEMQYGFYPEHTIATIVVDDPDRPYGREYYIDFTASQYGYTDHPKVTSKVASDGADYWTQSQDDWWGTQADSLFNVNVPGDAPGMPHEMITDSLHCPHCGGPMHGLECPSCGFKKEAKIPSMRQLQPHRYDSECYEVARAIADQWPHLQEDNGFYIHPKRGPGDHGWNIAPDGTIVDMTAVQHDYKGLASEEDWDEENAPAPEHPEVVPPGHPLYDRYVSWTRHPEQAQVTAHKMGYHNTDKVDICPLCFPQKTAAEDHWKDEPRDEEGKWTRHPDSLKPVRGKHHRLKVHDHDKSTPEHHIVRCFHCGAPMDVYKGEESTCLNCGERRGFEDPLLDSLKDHKHSRVAAGDPTKPLLQAGFEPFAQTNHADVFQWTDPGTGMLHRISVSRNNPDREQYVREDLGKCHSGRCRCGTQLWQPAQAEAMAGSEEPVRSNDQVQYQGETWVVGEIAGELADIINMQTGETEIAPVRELQLVAADMVPQDQVKVMPDEPLSDWGEGQWDSDTFLDHNMINEHLKSRAQVQQYKDFMERERRRQNAEWPEMGMREAAESPSYADDPDAWMADREAWYALPPGECPRCGREGTVHGNTLDGGKQEWCPTCGWKDTDEVQQQKAPQVGDYAKSRDGHPVQIMGLHTEGENLFATVRYLDGYQPYPSVGGRAGGTEEDPLWEHRVYDGKVVRPGGDYYNPKHWMIEPGLKLQPQDTLFQAKTAADNVPGAPVSDSGHWVYLDGHVGMGGIHSDIAESLARDLGYDDTKVNYLSNWIARGHVPEDMAVAVGTLKNNYPYIWNSTRDRNHVFDSVREHVDKNPIPAVIAMRRFAGFFLVSADVDELAEKARQNLFNREDLVNMNRQYLSPEGTPSASGLGQDEQGNITVPEGLKPEPNPKYNPGLYNDIQRTLERLPSEHYKFYPWVTKQMKKSVTPTLPGGGNVRYPWNTNGHLNDILTQAFRHMEYLRSQPKNSPNAAPVPDINQMDWPGLEKWVYDRNALGIDVRPGTQWEYTEKQPAYDEHTPPNLTAYKWPVQEKKWDVGDGYTVWPVWSKNDLAQEGNMMGHCVGGYCNTVQQGNSVIFSLRDSKGEPHVTIELEPRSGGYNIIQIQGKGNTDPDDKYVQKVKQFFQDLMAEGYEVSYTVSISDASELEDYGYTSTPSEAYGVPIEADINTYGIARDLAEQAADGYLSGSYEEGLDKLIDERLVDPRDLGAEIRSECEDKLEAKEREYESDWQDLRDRLEEKYEDAKREHAYARAEEEYNNMDPDDEDAEEPDPDDYEDEFPDFVDWLADYDGEAWEKEYYGTDFRQQAEDELPEVVDLMYRYG